VLLDEVEGKCYVGYADDLNISVDEYTQRGSDHFYFREVSFLYIILLASDQITSNVLNESLCFGIKKSEIDNIITYVCIMLKQFTFNNFVHSDEAIITNEAYILCLMR